MGEILRQSDRLEAEEALGLSSSNFARDAAQLGIPTDEQQTRRDPLV